MKIKWSITNVIYAGTPYRVESEVYLAIFDVFLAKLVRFLWLGGQIMCCKAHLDPGNSYL